VLGDDVGGMFEVTTADGARWRYIRTESSISTGAATGATRQVYRCTGRF
jgi:hypothetical protein